MLQTARHNCGPQAPCGLLSIRPSLGDDPLSPLFVTDGFAGTDVCEPFTLVLAIYWRCPHSALLSAVPEQHERGEAVQLIRASLSHNPHMEFAAIQAELLAHCR